MEAEVTRWNITDVPDSEVLERRRRGFEKVSQLAPDALLFFGSASIYYMLGGWMSGTERPECLILKNDGTGVIMVPRLEKEYCEKVGKCIGKIVAYDEYPGEYHPMKLLGDILTSLNLSKGNLVVDRNGYPNIMGYRGPKLSKVCSGARIIERPFLVEELQMFKSPFDQMIMRETARWGNLAHRLLRDYTKAGLTEFEVTDRVKAEATKAMLKTLGPGFVTTGPVEAHARAIFRGQVGKLSYWPHVTANNATIRRGDNLVTGASGFMLGLRTEMERTMFVGEPSDEQRKYYEHAYNLQQIGISNIRPGNTCSNVDKEVKRYYRENGLMKYWRHHTGHCIGYTGHERPFLDEYEDFVIQPNMVFTCEPGVYVEGIGGFRISDSILVRESGAECLTYFPKNIDEVICDK